MSHPVPALEAMDVSVAPVARRGAIYGWISMVLWMAVGIDSIVRPIQDNRREIWWWFPFIFMMLAIIAVHRVQRGPHLERYTFYVVMFASALVLAGNLGLIFGVPSLAWLGFPGGALVWTVGLVAFGIATWLAKVLPWYAALALILWEPGSPLCALLLAPISPLRERGSYSAGLEKGLAIGIVACGLWAVSKKFANSNISQPAR